MLTRVALIYNPGSRDPQKIDVPITTKAKDPVTLVAMSATTGDETGTEFGGKGGWTATLEAGVYGFATTAPFEVTNPNPSLVQVILASGKDPWPPPPPPPRAWSVSASEFYGWYAAFLMASGGQFTVPTGHKIFVTPYTVVEQAPESGQ